MNFLVERLFFVNDKYLVLGVNLYLVDIFLFVFWKFYFLDVDIFSLMLQLCYVIFGSVFDKFLMKRVKEGVFMFFLEEVVIFVKNI